MKLIKNILEYLYIFLHFLINHLSLATFNQSWCELNPVYVS